MKRSVGSKPASRFAAQVGQALRRSVVAAHKTAKQHGTPIYIWRDGKVVALKP